ncbi:MAG: hypothetical protein SNF33_00075 (plasmid) [Candidatus Algichlamydia australiensis]|nr:hypothetical protein [Chlamydiales bacterium]
MKIRFLVNIRKKFTLLLMPRDKKDDLQDLKKIKMSSVSIRVNYSTASKLEALISHIKAHKNHSFSKQQWIIDAIREKIENDKRLLKKTKFPKKGNVDKRLNCKIDEKLLSLLNEHLDTIENSYSIKTSKNSWISQAINEKMERDN